MVPLISSLLFVSFVSAALVTTVFRNADGKLSFLGFMTDDYLTDYLRLLFSPNSFFFLRLFLLGPHFYIYNPTSQIFRDFNSSSGFAPIHSQCQKPSGDGLGPWVIIYFLKNVPPKEVEVTFNARAVRRRR